MKILDDLFRQLSALKRPSKNQNLKRIKADQENLNAIVIRAAHANDIQALAQLHVQTWRETYWYVKKPPTVALRAQQWTEMFKRESADWFVLVVTNERGELIGFAKGQTYAHSDLPQFSSELNKIYLLQSYQRLGIGQKLLKAVAERLLGMGINNMVLFGDTKNPSGKFHEAMGAQKLYAKNGEFHGGYAWYDLAQLIKQI